METLDPSRIGEYVRGVDPRRSELLERARRILVFSPHPDDAEVIAGAYLAMKRSYGSEVRLVVVSDGRMGLPSSLTDEEGIAIRRAEQLEAAEVLGIEEVEFLDFVDSLVPEPGQLRDRFIRLTRSYAPDLVLTVDPYLPYESHPDHVNTGKGVLQAILFHSLPKFARDIPPSSPPPPVALGGTARPNSSICVDSFVEVKARALTTHRSQFDRETVEFITSVTKALGSALGCGAAEVFKVLTPRELHVNVFVET